MTNDRRPLWKSGILHAVLIGGSLVFALPYFWLLGTSWKLDKEVLGDEVSLFPQRPLPRPQSPYIDERQFPDIHKPEEVGRHRWDGWMRAAVEDEIGQCVDAWSDSRTEDLDPGAVRTELIQGVFRRLGNLLPRETWSADENTFRVALTQTLDPQFVSQAFEQAYRYFALGKVMVKDLSYNIYDLTGQTPVADLWTLDRGGAILEERQEAARPVGVIHYDFSGAGDSFEVSASLDLPFDADQFKRLEISFRRDQTWHELRCYVEMGGRLLKSSAPKYLGEDTWWDITLQEPSADDQRLVPKHYVLLKQIDSGPQYDHGPRTLKLRVEVARSSIPEAFWAKGTENYRKAFEEVPFWRYFKTSVFLVVANIIGTLFSCSMVAFALSRLTWPGRNLSFLLVLATLMIPPQVTMIPSFVIYKYLGWYNTLAPLWVPNCLAVNAFAIFLLRQAMMGIPRDLENAARIDGCGYFGIYWNVALPLMRPTMAAIAIFTFMFVWNDFMTPLIYVNDQRLYPLALGLFSFMAGRENQFTLIMAGSMIMTIPVVLTFFFAQRYFIQGVTMSGIKG
ncbi:MAG: ABC transporter permease subunit [Phycisphaerae bacterium]